MLLVEDSPAPARGEHEHEPADEVRMGYGKCSVWDCDCLAFLGSGTLCGNCNHGYDLHG
ncbi:MAG TPA: hypothetical protein VF712_06605 [Thermoleophilaceae bacterium]|jgi:hypothetical protein